MKRVSEMKTIYKIMKNYAYKDMCTCGNCGADFYFGGCCEIKKCPVCGYEHSEVSDNLYKFQERSLMDFFDYVVESVQHFDNKYTKFTMHGKTVTIDFKSSTMTCEDELGNVESCEVDVWILVALCDVYEFRESARRVSEMRTDEIKRALWDFAVAEFEYRLEKYPNADDVYYVEAAEAYFMRDVFWMFIKFMLDLSMDPESAYTLLVKDEKTLNAVFLDALKYAEFV